MNDEHENGDQVLVDAVLSRKSDGGGDWILADGSVASPGEIHAHPGVDIEALVREHELRDWLQNNWTIHTENSVEFASKQRESLALRRAREAAAKPPMKEPDWKALCAKLWSSAKGGYDYADNEAVRKVVDAMADWIEADQPGERGQAEPKLEEGQEVWAKGRVNMHGTISFRAPKPRSIHDIHEQDVAVHPDDIKVDEES